jgi:hypothetical protein
VLNLKHLACARPSAAAAAAHLPAATAADDTTVTPASKRARHVAVTPNVLIAPALTHDANMLWNCIFGGGHAGSPASDVRELGLSPFWGVCFTAVSSDGVQTWGIGAMDLEHVPSAAQVADVTRGENAWKVCVSTGAGICGIV